MIPTIQKIINISRYRFWIYTSGPYLIGFLLGSSSIENIFSPLFILSFLYFLIPANIFIYGVNDYFDKDTDKFNQKKGQQEFKLRNLDTRLVFNLILASSLFGAIFLILTPSHTSKITFILFIFLSYFYSAQPLRFKSKPFIDSLSNILYFLPGIIGYAQVSSALPPMSLLIAFLCWTTAMHLFSAIPDIKADTKAGLKTTAIVLGVNKSLILCLLLWLFFSSTVISFFNTVYLLFLFIYPLIPLSLLINKKLNITWVYWCFPYINSINGFLAFVLILKTKF